MTSTASSFTAFDRNLKKFFLSAYAVFTAFQIYAVAANPFIGRSDSASYAMVMRNVVEGKGLTIDSVSHFFKRYPDIHHEQDQYPVLPSLLLAPLYLLFGKTVFGAKLLNLLFYHLILWLTYRFCSRLADEKTAIFAVFVYMACDAMWDLSLYCMADLGSCFFTVLFVFLLFEWLEESGSAEKKSQRLIACGVLGGLMLMEKVINHVTLFSFVFFILVQNQRKGGIKYRAALIISLVALFVALPDYWRNFYFFGTPIFSYGGHLAVADKMDPSVNGMYRIFFDQPVSFARYLHDYGMAHWLGAVGQNSWRLVKGLLISGNLLNPVVILAGIFGIARICDRHQLRLLLLIWFLLFTGFMCVVQSYQARYYVPFVPFVAMGASFVFVRSILPFFRTAIRQFTALVVMGLVLAFPLIGSAAPDIFGEKKAGFVELAAWLERHTPAEAVLMTRSPWETSFHARRRTVMTPKGGREAVNRIVDIYGVSYFVIDGYRDARHQIEGLEPLYSGVEIPGFQKVHEKKWRSKEAYVYRIT